MADKKDQIRHELRELVVEGGVITMKLAAEGSEDLRKKLLARLDAKMSDARDAAASKDSSRIKKDSRDIAAVVDRVMTQPFAGQYQSWYSRATRLVEQLLSDRRVEFVELYRRDRRPKDLDPSTYSISDYINGIVVAQGYRGEPAFDTTIVAVTKLQTQVGILASIQAVLDSSIADITGMIEATLLDDELDAARGLLKAKYLRAAGVVAGVVLERHPKRVLDSHNISFRKKAQIGNLNDALKDAGVYGVVEWRQIQRLGDIRNLSGHAGERDPRPDEIDDLISGASKVIATIF